MSEHQHDMNATPLWFHFQTVINWVNTYFTKYRKEMKGIDWGRLCEHKADVLDPVFLEERIKELMIDDEVTSKKGIYEYLLTGKEKFLSLRQFSDSQKRQAYERQGGICANCGKHFEIEQMEGDHHKPWSLGGKTDNDNCVMLCRDCNREKSNK
ncbi:MAG: HNH endonuclease [Ruminococcus sp.]|nr:HNH endonuclease [Ruminococcus sp.]